MVCLFIANLERGQKSLLGQFHVAHSFHALFAFFLFFQQLALAGDVAAIAFCGYILAEGGNSFPGDYFLANGRLDGNHEKLARNGALELERQGAPVLIGLVLVDNYRKRIDWFPVQHNVKPHQVGLLVAAGLVINGSVAAAD